MSVTILYLGGRVKMIHGQAAITQVGLRVFGNKIMKPQVGNKIMTLLTSTSQMLFDSLVLCNFKIHKLIIWKILLKFKN